MVAGYVSLSLRRPLCLWVGNSNDNIDENNNDNTKLNHKTESRASVEKFKAREWGEEEKKQVVYCFRAAVQQIICKAGG